MDRFCGNCGNELSAGNRFCLKCGMESKLLIPSSSPTERETVSAAPQDPKRELPKVKKAFRIILYVLAGLASLVVFVLVLATLIFMWVEDTNLWSSSPSAKVSPPSHLLIPTAAPTAVPVIEADLRSVLDLLEANKVAADAEYKGKLIKITGAVHSIEKDYFTLIPLGSDMFQLSGAKCTLVDEEKSKLVQLRPEQIFTVKGLVTGFETFLINRVEIIHCRILGDAVNQKTALRRYRTTSIVETEGDSDIGETFPEQPYSPHIGFGQEHPPYNSIPASSGWHYDTPTRWGIYDTFIADETLVHNLEHGGVRIHYDCPDGCPNLVKQLEDVAEFRTEVVMSPYPDMGSKIALVAWTVLDKFDEFDEQRIKDFINAHMNSTRSPERWAE